MSRATFALHFKAAAGVGPLGYLTEWRMRLAERALSQDGCLDRQARGIARLRERERLYPCVQARHRSCTQMGAPKRGGWSHVNLTRDYV
jgi:AraC-like DNA-binding protein